MRKYLLTLGIGLAAIAIAAYLTRILPPFNAETISQIVSNERILSEEELLQVLNRLSQNGSAVILLNWRNLLIILTIGGLGVAALTAFLHLLLAKITSSPFTTRPKTSTAIRRGVEVSLVAILLIVFRLTLADLYLLILVPIFVLILEVAITQQLFKPEITDEELFLDDQLENGEFIVSTQVRSNIKMMNVRKDPTQLYDMPEELGDSVVEELDNSVPKELDDSTAEVALESEAKVLVDVEIKDQVN